MCSNDHNSIIQKTSSNNNVAKLKNYVIDIRPVKPYETVAVIKGYTNNFEFNLILILQKRIAFMTNKKNAPCLLE